MVEVEARNELHNNGMAVAVNRSRDTEAIGLEVDHELILFLG